MGRLVCTLTDTPMRVEGRMATDFKKGREEVLRQNYRGLTKELTALRGEAEGIIAFVESRVR